MKVSTLVGSLLGTLALTIAQEGPIPNVQRMPYDHDGYNLTGFYAIPEGASEDKKVPAVIIIPDWDGVNYYEQQRATMVATDLGYVGFAADIYGSQYEDGVPDDERGKLAGRYRSQEPMLFLGRIAAAVTTVSQMPEVDTSKIALAGYCFGGSGVLMFAVDDGDLNDNVQAVVSFHGGLGPDIFDHRENVTTDVVNDVRPRVLVLSGGEDDMATDVMTLETTLNNATGIMWEITRYSGIQHAFTVFGDDRYNQWADERSWASMIQFLEETFGEITYESGKPAEINVENVTYVDETDGKQLQGYLAKPNSTIWKSPSPAVVIIPDWDGVNLYEKERATMLAESGYVAFAADIFGADLQENLTMDVRINQTTLYRSENVTLFVSRMHRAVELVQSYDFVDAANIAIIGYCFGGTGVVQYAFMGRDDVKLVAAFHGNVQEKYLPEVMTPILPYTMVLSGGEDDAHGNQTILEASLKKGNASWEISRWSGVFHGFTDFDGDAYNLNADVRSWTALMTAMAGKMSVPERTDGSSPGDSPPTDSPPSASPPTDSPPTDSPPAGSPPTESPPTDSPPTGSPPTGSPPTESPPAGAPPTGSPPAGSPPTESPPSNSPPTGPAPEVKPQSAVAYRSIAWSCTAAVGALVFLFAF